MTDQPQLPFSTAPMDWTQPVECRFNQLRDTVAAGKRAGFRVTRMHVVKLGYRLEFCRDDAMKCDVPRLIDA